MSRIATPASIEEAPPAARPLLEAVKKLLGTVPNLFRMVANSPAALEGYVGLLGALSKGALPAATHERIALAVAEANGCDYCLSAHAWLGKNVAKLRGRRDDGQSGRSVARSAARAPRCASPARSWSSRGHVSDAELRAVRDAGYDRRAAHRDRATRGTQHVDQLHQQRGQYRHRLSGGGRPQGGLSRSERDGRIFQRCGLHARGEGRSVAHAVRGPRMRAWRRAAAGKRTSHAELAEFIGGATQLLPRHRESRRRSRTCSIAAVRRGFCG